MTDTKHCPFCPTETANETLKCEGCGFNYRNLGPTLGAGRMASGSSLAATPVATVIARPDGSKPLAIAWVCLAAAVTLFLLSLILRPSAGDLSDSYRVSHAAHALMTQRFIQVFSGGCKVDDLAGHSLREVIAFPAGLHRVFSH